MNKFDMMSKDALSRVEEIMNATKLNEFLHRKEEEEKQRKYRDLLNALLATYDVSKNRSIAFCKIHYM